jgi:hypothetical protein
MVWPSYVSPALPGRPKGFTIPPQQGALCPRVPGFAPPASCLPWLLCLTRNFVDGPHGLPRLYEYRGLAQWDSGPPLVYRILDSKSLVNSYGDFLSQPVISPNITMAWVEGRANQRPRSVSMGSGSGSGLCIAGHTPPPPFFLRSPLPSRMVVLGFTGTFWQYSDCPI